MLLLDGLELGLQGSRVGGAEGAVTPPGLACSVETSIDP